MRPTPFQSLIRSLFDALTIISFKAFNVCGTARIRGEELLLLKSYLRVPRVGHIAVKVLRAFVFILLFGFFFLFVLLRFIGRRKEEKQQPREKERKERKKKQKKKKEGEERRKRNK